MSTTKHAPGPWKAQGLAIVASDRSFVGRLYPWCADPQDSECAKANARLIAAAPELLEALESIIDAADYAAYKGFGGAEAENQIMRARSAIIKAR